MKNISHLERNTPILKFNKTTLSFFLCQLAIKQKTCDENCRYCNFASGNFTKEVAYDIIENMKSDIEQWENDL
jgi:biotin synthase-like enzyme